MGSFGDWFVVLIVAASESQTNSAEKSPSRFFLRPLFSKNRDFEWRLGRYSFDVALGFEPATCGPVGAVCWWRVDGVGLGFGVVLRVSCSVLRCSVEGGVEFRVEFRHFVR